MTPAEKRVKAKEKFKGWARDPEGYVLDVFGPGYQKLRGEELTPDPWQKEALGALATWKSRRFAYAASKNALKTCTMAWDAWWLLGCHMDAQGMATSISDDQLKMGLWKELAVWYGMAPLLQAMFVMTAESIRSRERPATWFLNARSWAKGSDPFAIGAAMKGLHGPFPFYLGDEAGDYGDGPVEAAEGMFAGADAEAYLIIAGNTPRQSGPLYRAVQNREGLYWVKRISGDPDDPKRCTRVSIEWAKSQLAQCNGDRNHPHYKINVLGEFPDVASDKLLGPDDLDRAMSRNPRQQDFEHDPIIVGIDTADGGGDQTMLCVRWGCVVFRLKPWRTPDPMVQADQIAAVLADLSQVSQVLEGRRADGIFVDLGGPSGHGIQSRLVQLGYGAVGVDFGTPPVWADKAAPTFENRRAEMGWRAAQWVKSIGSLPDDQLLRSELLEPSFWLKKTGPAKFLFEPKDAIKARLNRSPDRADSLWLTFAAPVVPGAFRAATQHMAVTAQREFNPFASMGGRT